MTLKEMRFYAGLTQIELSQKTGIHQSTLCHLEKGRLQVTEEQKASICKVFCVDENLIDWGLEHVATK